MAQQNSSELIAQGGDKMAIHMDGMDYYYNETNQSGCWGAGQYTPQGFYEPSNPYMLNNATQIKQDLTAKGWSFNAIMAVLGNMAYESFLNPAQSEIGQPLDGTYGYGLCQWTPRNTTIEPYLNGRGYPLTSGYYQLDYLDTGAQWIPTSAYNMSWNDFKHSVMGVQYLTKAFLKCYERGRDNDYRYYCSNYYEQYFGGAITGNQVLVTYEGNGLAYASPSIVEDGENFILYANPASGETLDSIIGTTANGASIAMQLATEWGYTYDETNWGKYITVHVTFSGETPVPPVPPPTYIQKKHMPIWMYPMFRK